MTTLHTVSWVVSGKPGAFATFDPVVADQVMTKLQRQGAIIYQSSHHHQGEVIVQAEPPEQPIILLDLNYTLVANSKETWPGFKGDPDVEQEQYRNWLVDLIRDHQVILITVRANHLAERTLANIQAKTNWQPQKWYMKAPHERFVRAPVFKQKVLMQHIFPTYGANPDQYLALESNSETRAMYSALNIQAVKVPKKPWPTLPTVAPQVGGLQQLFVQEKIKI